MKGTIVLCPDPTLAERKRGLVTIRHPARPFSNFTAGTAMVIEGEKNDIAYNFTAGIAMVIEGEKMTLLTGALWNSLSQWFIIGRDT